MNWYSIVLQKLVTRRPSVKLFRQNSRIFDTRGKTTDSGHIFWHSLLWKKENGIGRKVFGLFAALYHLEEWLNCHWKSVKVIFRVGGHFLYLLMAEHNNLMSFGVSRSSNQWKCDLLRLHNILTSANIFKIWKCKKKKKIWTIWICNVTTHTVILEYFNIKE